MPTLSYDKKDLLSLIGRDLSDSEIEAVISQIKEEVEEINEKEVIVELEPERPDLFGVEGLARCIKGLLDIETGLKTYAVEPSGMSIEIENAQTRPFVGAAVVKGMHFTDASIKSIMNIQEALHATIGNKRAKVAVGIHDLSKISGPITYTDIPKQTTMIPLDMPKEMTLEQILQEHPKGKEYAHLVPNNCPVFKDSQGIFSFPPIINSERTRVKESTTDLFIEVTGTDKKSVNYVLNIIVTNLADRGCRIESVSVNGEKTPDLSPKDKYLNPNLISKLVGIDLENGEIVHMLRRERHDAFVQGDRIVVRIPCYRVDVLHEVDLVEDVAIAYNYKNIQPLMPNLFTVGKLSRKTRLVDRIREIMAGFGLQEVRTFTLSNVPLQNSLKVQKNLVELENPISQDYNCIRAWILPHLLRFLSVNKHVDYPQEVFEVGRVAENTKESDHISCVITGSKITFNEARSLLEGLMRELGRDITLSEVEYPFLIKGRAADVFINNKKTGFIGEIHPEILNDFGLDHPVAVFELEVESLASD